MKGIEIFWTITILIIIGISWVLIQEWLYIGADEPYMLVY